MLLYEIQLEKDFDFSLTDKDGETTMLGCRIISVSADECLTPCILPKQGE